MAAVLLAFALPSDAGAWSGPKTLSQAGSDAIETQLAVNEDGEAAFVWRRRDTAGYWRIQGRMRSAAGTLGPIVTLSAASQNSYDHDVAIDDSGRAVFVWEQRRSDGKYVITASRMGLDSVASSRYSLSPPGSGDHPQIELDPLANAVVVWQDFDAAGDTRVLVRSLSAADPPVLSAIQYVSQPGEGAGADQNELAIDGGGIAHIVWSRFDGANMRVQTRTRSAAGTLGPITTLSAAGQWGVRPDVAVTPTGDALFAWHRDDGSEIACCQRVQVKARSAAGVFSATQTISRTGESATAGQAPDVALQDDADAVIVWQQEDPCCSTDTWMRTRSASGVIGGLKKLAADSAYPRTAYRPSGEAVILFHAALDYDDRVRSRVLAADQTTLGPAVSLSAAGEDVYPFEPDLGLDGTGQAFAAWSREDGTDWSCCDRAQFASGG